MALSPGQYQIGNFVFGAKTMYRVEAFDIAGYDVNVQDFQAAISDELRFGQDSLKPLPIQLTINALVNRPLPNVMALMGQKCTNIGPFSNASPIDAFAAEWHSDDVRGTWGAIKPLSICKEDGSVVRVYGRPGKLAVSKLPAGGIAQKIIAEFRRSDTFAYSDTEWYVICDGGSNYTVTRGATDGNAPAWVRFLCMGPITHPIISWSNSTSNMSIELDVDIGSGEVVEISSYPWERRVVSDSGINYASLLTQPYLDQIKMAAMDDTDISWSGTGSGVIWLLWRDAWNVV